MMTESPPNTRCGLVAIAGRPNVGKSTLLNHILRQKISITSRRPQTTRHRILGISTAGDVQAVFADTPGLHAGQGGAMNRLMNETVHRTLKDVDLILFVVEGLRWSKADERVLDLIKAARTPAMLLINKIDRLADKSRLLPHIQKLSKKYEFAEIIPVSALGGHNLPAVEKAVAKLLPAGPFLFPAEQTTDRSARFRAAELVREKVTRQLGDEVPYEVTVEIEKFQREAELLTVHALVSVERPGQKRMLIGSEGARLKRIGSAAREDMERAFGCKVMLNLWVKVRSGWSDDVRVLRSLGYGD